MFKKIFAPLEKLKAGLAKTRQKIGAGLKAAFSFARRVDENVITELEEAMISADMGVPATTKILDEVRKAYKRGEIPTGQQLKDFLKLRLREQLTEKSNEINLAAKPPTVILVCGVNGSGKTTSIAKLAQHFKADGNKVLLAASDTFRAAAVEQLEIWSQRIGVELVKHHTGADPAAVTFDAVEAAIARGVDVLIVDTAGRLHTKTNLMNELNKIKRVIQKRIPDAPHESLLVLDATTGQNAIQQAKLFNEAVQLTGIFLAKLDGTAKGGIIVAIKNELDIPVKFIGLGETPQDIETFDAARFVDALID